MKKLLIALNGTGLVMAGIVGQWFDHMTFAPYAIWLFAAGFGMLIFVALSASHYRS